MYVTINQVWANKLGLTASDRSAPCYLLFSRYDLLEIVDDRHEKGSLLVTSQIPVKRWHELIADPTLGDAILDRVVHRAHRIDLTGPSLRKRNAISTPADTEGSASGSASDA